MAEAKKTVIKKSATKVAKPSAKKIKEEKPKDIEQVVDAKGVKAETKPAVTKAGKHSAKALKEAEAEKAKEERKAADNTEKADEAKPKHSQKPPRTKLERSGKKFREAAKLIEVGKTYSLTEAVELAVKTSPVKFDATVELHVRLNIDPKRSDQNIREIIVLPAGTGKTIRVAVLAEANDVTKAKKAGAEVAGHDDLLAQIEKGDINFDTLIATPSMMPKLGKYARVLGPKGLMPSPKSGTVTTDVTKAVEQAKAGRVEYRADSTGIVHLGIGKVSFGSAKLLQNAEAMATSLKQSKPGSVKGLYILSAHLTTSMGPSIITSLE